MRVSLDIPGIKRQLDFNLHNDNDNCVSRELQTNGIWEPYETALLIEQLHEGGIFLDIGANIGYYTVIAATLVGDTGKVVAYEPDEENFRLLQENIAVNSISNVDAFMAAVADYNGSDDLYLSADNKGDHHLYDNGDGRQRCQVAVVNGGDHVAKITRHVDVVKIDTQGAETRIVKGLYDLLRENQHSLTMVVELWPYGLRQAASSGGELIDLLASLDLSLYIIDHIGHNLWPVHPDFLRQWVDETDADPENEGFINILARSRQND